MWSRGLFFSVVVAIAIAIVVIVIIVAGGPVFVVVIVIGFVLIVVVGVVVMGGHILDESVTKRAAGSLATHSATGSLPAGGNSTNSMPICTATSMVR